MTTVFHCRDARKGEKTHIKTKQYCFPASYALKIQLSITKENSVYILEENPVSYLCNRVITLKTKLFKAPITEIESGSLFKMQPEHICSVGSTAEQ